MGIKVKNLNHDSVLGKYVINIGDHGNTGTAPGAGSAISNYHMLPFNATFEKSIWCVATDFSGSNGIALRVRNLNKNAVLLSDTLHSQCNTLHGGGVDFSAGLSVVIVPSSVNYLCTAGTVIETLISGTVALANLAGSLIFKLDRKIQK